MPLLRAGPSPGSVTNNSNGLASATLRPPYGVPRRPAAVSFDLPGRPNAETRKIASGGERKTSAKLQVAERKREGEGGRREGTRKKKTIPRGKV